MDADEKLRLATERVSAALRGIVEELEITEGELRAALGFLAEVGRAGQLPLLSDVLGVSVAVDDVTYGAGRQGTASSVEGPFYRPDAPVRTQIARDDEPGDVCFVSGRVTDAGTGAPLAGALPRRDRAQPVPPRALPRQAELPGLPASYHAAVLRRRHASRGRHDQRGQAGARRSAREARRPRGARPPRPRPAVLHLRL